MVFNKPHKLIQDNEPVSASILTRMLATEYRVQRAQDTNHVLKAARRTGVRRTRPSPAPKPAAGVPDEAKRSAVRQDLARSAAGAGHFRPPRVRRPPPTAAPMRFTRNYSPGCHGCASRHGAGPVQVAVSHEQQRLAAPDSVRAGFRRRIEACPPPDRAHDERASASRVRDRSGALPCAQASLVYLSLAPANGPMVACRFCANHRSRQLVPAARAHAGTAHPQVG